jgi:hypothetical protein
MKASWLWLPLTSLKYELARAIVDRGFNASIAVDASVLWIKKYLLLVITKSFSE